MGKRALGPREVDQHVGGGERPVDIVRHRHAGAMPDALARILADEGAARDVERRGQREVGCGKHRLHQRLPHAPTGARHRDAETHQLPFRISRNRPK